MSQRDAGNPLKPFKSGADESCGPFQRVMSKCAWVSFNKGKLEEGWILCKING